MRLFGRKRRRFTFPAPIHHDPVVQSQLFRVAYILTAIENNEEQRVQLHRQELELRKTLAKKTSNLGYGSETRQIVADELMKQITNIVSAHEELADNNDAYSEELTRIALALPEGIDTLALFGSRIPQS